MAIGTDDAIDKFGTQDTLTSVSPQTSSVSNNALSVAADITTWTNDDDAPMASVILKATWSVAPTAFSTVTLLARLMNIESTNDQEEPDTNFLHTYMGTFTVNDVTSQQVISIDVLLPNTKSSQEYDFYILNETGQAISAAWNLYITPKTLGPHA